MTPQCEPTEGAEDGLKPCPFCGGSNISAKRWTIPAVCCEDCGGGITEGYDQTECVSLSSIVWNTRHIDAELSRLRTTIEGQALTLQDSSAALAMVTARVKALEEALRGMLLEWDKFSRYGSPLAKASNETVNKARAALNASAVDGKS